MQVALVTLWSCFPVSASGADVLLFSLLHTSSGSSCSPETNHGLLRSSRSPFFFFLSLSLSILSPFFSLFLSFFFLFFSFLCSDFFHLSVSLLIALLPFGHTKVALPQRGHAECPGEGKRPGPQRSSPPGRKKRGEGPLTLPLLPTLSPCL